MSNLDFIWEIILDKLKLCTLDTKIYNKKLKSDWYWGIHLLWVKGHQIKSGQ